MALILGAVVVGCGGAEDDRRQAEEVVIPEPPTLYPGVLDLPAATALGFLRCSPAGAGEVSLGPAPLSRDFIEAYRIRPPWEPETPSFLPVDPEENQRWMQLMELRSRFLFRRNPATGGWQPDAAGSAELSVAEGRLTVRLREDLVWSDGSPAAATDWVVAVEQIYQLPGIQSPLKAQTEAGGAVWRAIDDTTIEVLFESIPPDPLALLAVPPLPLADPRIASLAQGNVDVLFDLETSRESLPTLRRSGETTTSSAHAVAGAPGERPGSLLASTGAGDRGLLFLSSGDLDASVLEEFLGAVREPGEGNGLLLLPWDRLSGVDGARSSETTGGPLPSQIRIAYSFDSPGAQRAAGLLSAHLQGSGIGDISVVPENADIMESSLPFYLSGGRPLPADLVVLEVAVDALTAVPVSLRTVDSTEWSNSCAGNRVDGLGGWYDCIEAEATERMAAIVSGSSAPVRLFPAGLLPRIVLLRPSACFTEPVPYGAGIADLLAISGDAEKEES